MKDDEPVSNENRSHLLKRNKINKNLEYLLRKEASAEVQSWGRASYTSGASSNYLSLSPYSKHYYYCRVSPWSGAWILVLCFKVEPLSFIYRVFKVVLRRYLSGIRHNHLGECTRDQHVEAGGKQGPGGFG